MDLLCNLGKKVCVAGAVLVSLPVAVPIIVPPLFVLSVVGVALAIPVGSAAVGFVVVKRVLGLGKQTAGYISAPPARLYENMEEIHAEDFGKHGVESDKENPADGESAALEIEEEALAPAAQLHRPKKVRGDSVSEIVTEELIKDFAACDAESAAPEIEEEALAPASQLYSGDSVGEIVEEEPVKHDLPISRASEAESEPWSPPTLVYENKKVSGDSRGGCEVVESGNPGGDSNKNFAGACGVTAQSAAESEHVKAEPEALTSPTQLYESKQVNGHLYSDDIVENDPVKHIDESIKDNAGRDVATESKEAAQATESTEIVRAIEESTGNHQGEAKTPDFDDGLRAENCDVEVLEVPQVSEESIGDHQGFAAEGNVDDGLRAAENCDVEASPKLGSPKLPTENSLEPLANNPESVVQADVGEMCAEEVPEKCCEMAHKPVEQVYVKEFEDVDSPSALPCKSAPDFYECMEAKEMVSADDVEVEDAVNENSEEGKDVDPPRLVEVSPKLLKPDVVPEPVEHVADVSVELAPEMCWETATEAAERICVDDPEDADSLKNAVPFKTPDFYEHMDVKELDSLDDHVQEARGEGEPEEAATVNENVQQVGEVEEGNAEEIVEDGVVSASGNIGIERKALNRVESNGYLEESAGAPEGEEQIHFENAVGSTDGQVPTASIGSGHHDEIALASDEETFRVGAASEDDQSRSCGPEVVSFLKPSVSMIPV